MDYNFCYITEDHKHSAKFSMAAGCFLFTHYEMITGEIIWHSLTFIPTYTFKMFDLIGTYTLDN